MDTIVALASGVGRSGVAVIRISGPQVRFILETISGGVPQPRTAALRILRSGEGAVIDRGLVLFFPGPNSFTGEDLAEFQVHGSPAVVRRLLSVLSRSCEAVRIAEPGEFTLRAFRNGKMDLTEVEALGQLIDSDTERQAEAAQAGLDGHLRRRVEAWSGELLRVLAGLEAEIDFSDEGDVAISEQSASTTLGLVGLARDLEVLLDQARGSRRLRDGIAVAIAGPPNVGKSSLLNALVRRDVAIVSTVPGTTRDLIEAVVDIDGWPVRFIDSAGLRDADDAIEAEGIRRARQNLGTADLVLWLGLPEEAPGPNSIRVRSKSDLSPVSDGPFDLAVSAVTGDGLDDLRTLIADRAEVLVGEAGLIVTERQESELRRCHAAVSASMQPGLAEELVVEELRRALRALDRLVGRIGVEDVLGEIFSRFCIGK